MADVGRIWNPVQGKQTVAAGPSSQPWTENESAEDWTAVQVVAHTLAARLKTKRELETHIKKLPSHLRRLFAKDQELFDSLGAVLAKVAFSRPHGRYELKPQVYPTLKIDTFPYMNEKDRQRAMERLAAVAVKADQRGDDDLLPKASHYSEHSSREKIGGVKRKFDELDREVNSVHEAVLRDGPSEASGANTDCSHKLASMQPQLLVKMKVGRHNWPKIIGIERNSRITQDRASRGNTTDPIQSDPILEKIEAQRKTALESQEKSIEYLKNQIETLKREKMEAITREKRLSGDIKERGELEKAKVLEHQEAMKEVGMTIKRLQNSLLGRESEITDLKFIIADLETQIKEERKAHNDKSKATSVITDRLNEANGMVDKLSQSNLRKDAEIAYLRLCQKDFNVMLNGAAQLYTRNQVREREFAAANPGE